MTTTEDDVAHPPPPLLDSPEDRRRLERLELLATWMDRRFIDPVVGFVFPGGGDVLCALIGLYGVFVAIRIGVHPVVVARMLVNLAVDALAGSIPLLGAVFDVFYRAHVRNVALIHQRGSYGPPSLGDWVIVSGAVALFLLALSVPLIVVGLTIGLLAGWFR